MNGSHGATIPEKLFIVLFDGYNVIKQHPNWDRLSLEQARLCLRRAAETARWPFPVGRIVLIFDGPESGRGARQGRTEEHFAQSADASIQRRARTFHDPEHLVVITNDIEIRNTAKVNRVKVYSCKWFYDKLSTGRAKRNKTLPSKPHRSSKLKIPPSQAQAITEELAKIWLSESPKRKKQ